MASANLDLVRSLYAAWERGDFSSTEWADPEIELVVADGPDRARWTGLVGLAEGWRDFISTWDEFRAEVVEYRELGDERILVLVYWTGRGKTSGIDLRHMGAKAASLFHVRGGKVTRLGLYMDHEHALADLGLSTEADSRRS